MATTFTVSEVASGDTLYTYSSLARGDTCAAINVTPAKRIVAQVMSGNTDTDTILVEGSLDGTNWGPMYPPDAVSLTGIPAVAIGFIGNYSTAASGQTAVQPTYWLRVRVLTGGGGAASNIKCCILLRTMN
jgi:hypothetical protein